jgi:tetratricopeptide (TPR) repeat protein
MSHRAGVRDGKYVDRIREVVSQVPEVEQAALEVEHLLADEGGDDDLFVGALESLLVLDPSNVDRRFALAYKYSDLGREDLAAYHYLKMPDASRSALAWNNLGVSYERLGLHVEAVRAYRRAEAAGETLAVSNLAIRLLDAGFLAEAMRMLEAAQAIAGHHKNVDSTMSRAKGVDKDEAEKEKVALGNSGAVSAFYREFGRAATKVSENLAGTWNGREGPLLISQTMNSIVACGQFFEPSGLLALAFIESKLGATEERRSALEVEYRGVVQGRTVTATKRIRPLDKAHVHAASSLLIGGESTTVLMWLSDDGLVLKCMERTGTGSPVYYSIVKPS